MTALAVLGCGSDDPMAPAFPEVGEVRTLADHRRLDPATLLEGPPGGEGARLATTQRPQTGGDRLLYTPSRMGRRVSAITGAALLLAATSLIPGALRAEDDPFSNVEEMVVSGEARSRFTDFG